MQAKFLQDSLVCEWKLFLEFLSKNSSKFKTLLSDILLTKV